MSLIHMTVKMLRETAKANGLTGYSRMVKADLVELIASNTTVHKVGDVVRNVYNGRVGTVTYSNDAAVTVTCEDGGPILSGQHFMFTYTGVRNIGPTKLVTPVRKGMDRYGHWALSQPCVNGGTWDVRQGHADYCAEFGHATYTVDGVVMSWCPRCGETIKKPEQVISDLDAIDHGHAVEVMRQVVDNGREDLLPILDTIDASSSQTPNVKSSVPCVPGCEKCTGSVNRCDACMLAWLVDLYKITGDVKLNELPAVPEFDCYA